MSDLRFGDILGMDHSPATRVMVLCPAKDPKLLPGAWEALVIADDDWPVGLIVTFRPDGRGMIFIGRAEDL